MARIKGAIRPIRFIRVQMSSPMNKIAIIHTSPATLEPLKALAAELLPGYQVANFLDDSILPELAENGGDVAAVADRLLAYAGFAEQAGATAILSACSSVGEVVARMRDRVAVPVVRIDEAMAEEAVRRGRRIGVAATLPTTLNPTMRLLAQKAAEAGREVELTPALAGGAYQKLMAGDRDGHDADLVAVLSNLAQAVDVVVLAQASMARVLPRLAEGDRKRVLTSPRLGVEQLKHELEQR
jgi:Asp/Glu/hydantoin racemase